MVDRNIYEGAAINTKDDFGLSYANPEMLQPDFGSLTPVPMFMRQQLRTEFDTVDPMAGIMPMPGGDELPVQNIETDLMRLRAEIPFVPIMKWPVSIQSVLLVTPKVPKTIDVPRGVVLGMFRGSADFYVSRVGNVPDPTTLAGFQTQNAANNVDDLNAFGAMFKPDFAWFYIGGMSQFSVLSTVANCVVQLVCMAPQNWPNK